MKYIQIIVTLWSSWNIGSIILLTIEPPSFTEQTKYPGFVDKTMLIETVFQRLNCHYHLLTYPSKFGKSSALKMIQSFVELEVDKCGHVKKKWDTSSFKLFTNKSLGLKITQHYHLIRKHLAEYPVIYITFRNIIRPTFEETVQELSNRIKECYEKYHWLYEVLKNDSLQETSDEWGYLLRGQIEFWNRTYVNRCRAVDVQNSLFALSKILNYYLDKTIFVLIDDYDAPLIEAISSGEKISYHVFLIQDYVNGIIHKLFKPTCVDQYIEYGFVTGTTSYIVSTTSFTKIQSIRHYRFLDSHILIPFFGFNRREIGLLQQLHSLYPQNQLEHNETIMDIYSGYRSNNTSKKIYNPYLCSRYFNEYSQNGSKPMKFLSNVIEIDFLTSLTRNPRIRECLLELLNSRLIRFKLLTHINAEDFRKLYKVASGTKNEFDFDVFYTLLYEMGYLSYTDQEGMYSVPKEISNVFIDYLVT